MVASAEVKIVPSFPVPGSITPTATNVLFTNNTLFELLALGGYLGIQVEPSVEVTIFPNVPTATKVSFPKAAPDRPFVVPEVCAVQMVPSGEVTIFPPSPTATKTPLP